LTFSLGNTVGDRDGVKGLLFLLLQRLLTSDSTRGSFKLAAANT
jgi:hypothetical protein